MEIQRNYQKNEATTSVFVCSLNSCAAVHLSDPRKCKVWYSKTEVLFDEAKNTLTHNADNSFLNFPRNGNAVAIKV